MADTICLHFVVTLKVLSKSSVTWDTCLPILVFLGLSVLDLGQMYMTHTRRAREAY